MSINKALSGTEVPLKVKHARVAIIGTFHSRGAHSFWAVATRQPLQVCLNLFNGISSRGRALILFLENKTGKPNNSMEVLLFATQSLT